MILSYNLLQFLTTEMVLLRIKDYNVSSLNNDTTKVRRTESSYEVDVDFMTSSILKGQ